ncbi:centrosomal protein [Sarotherodon galilaeus]
MAHPSSVITQVRREEEEGEENACLREEGSVAVSSSKKSYSRGFLHRLFSCLCNKDAKPPPVKINAPLSLEENGTKTATPPTSSVTLHSEWTLQLDASHLGVGLYRNKCME